MQNQDLNAIRDAVKGQQKAARRAGGRSLSGTVRAVAAVPLLTVSLVLTVSAAAVARQWLGDHTVTDGKQWAALRAIGVTADHIPPDEVASYLAHLESSMLLWLFLLAAVAVVLRWNKAALGAAILIGAVYGPWWVSWPTVRPPAAVAELIGRQATAACGAGVWTWMPACAVAVYCARLAGKARGK